MAASVAALSVPRRRGAHAPGPRGAVSSWVVLGAAVACALLVVVLPPRWAPALYVLGGLVSLTGTVRGLVLGSSITRPYLAVFAAAGASFLVGIVVRPSDALSSGQATGIADVFTFAGYVGLLVFLTRMLRSSSSAPAAVVLDVVAVTCGASLLAWVLLVHPVLERTGRTAVEDVRSAAYVAADVLILAVVVQMAFRRTALVPASLLSGGGMLALLGGDLTYAAYDAGWSIAVPERYWPLAYLLGFGLFGAMALHPSLGRFVSSDRSVSWSSERARFGMLLVALAVPVLLPLVHAPEDETDQLFRVVSSGLVVATVFIRLVMTAGQLSEAARRLGVAEQVSRTRAERDSLTGLLNRRTVLQCIDEQLGGDRAQQHVLYVDLDGFKPINDTWGHAHGDAVLVTVAARFESALLDGEVLGRVGGDEFVVLTDRDPHAAAGRLRSALVEPFMLDRVSPRTLTASIGLARADGDEDAEALVQRADMAMYSVKNAHRDGVATFTVQMHEAIADRQRMIEELRGALGTDQLFLLFQPIVDAASRSVRGYEALLRWRSPVLGAVPPDQVVAAAESSNLMGSLGAWILERSLDELAAHVQDEPSDPPFMSINVSARQLEDDSIVALVRRLVAERDLDPGLVWLELSETASLAGSSQAVAVAHELRTAGLRIALDDFGTGYAALTHLRRLRPDVVKIDRSFVSGDGEGLTDEAVTTAVIAMSHAIGATVVGEGVETREQADLLGLLGCDLVQGYLVGRPAAGLTTPVAAAEAVA
ncbi:MAG: bifunctional diguanylate cyclase/phosphodiesterase [Nocardioidaceae bacterium]|nr:bifunctional diguanylate cyclase/phosphodiesterase [Nocardioidaceae bacterium]